MGRPPPSAPRRSLVARCVPYKNAPAERGRLGMPSYRTSYRRPDLFFRFAIEMNDAMLGMSGSIELAFSKSTKACW